MKYVYTLIIVFLGLCFCTTEKNTYIITPVPPVDTTTPCNISVMYSQMIRESTFKGFRDGIDFGIDTFTAGIFNGVIDNPDTGGLNCDSISQYWLSFVADTWSCTTTCYYGPDTARWLDTFYFKYAITGLEN